MNAQLVDPKLLDPSPLNPRKSFDKAKLEDLAKSVKGPAGIIEPLVVRAKGDRFEVIAGERRRRASLIAKLATVPVVVRELTDAEALEIQVIENNQREDVNPLEEAHGFRALMDADPRYHDRQLLAERLGRDLSYVDRRLRLLELPKAVQAGILDGSVSLAIGLVLARLSAAGMTQALDHFRDEQKYNRAAPTARDLSRWIAEHVLLKLAAAPFSTTDAALIPSAGPCTTCPKRTGNAPSLFDDVKDGDTCTDGRCYEAKVVALVGRKAAEVQGVPLAFGYHFDTEAKKRLKAAGAIFEHEGNAVGFKVLPANAKTCADETKGVVLERDSYDKRKVGDVVRVCQKPKTCKVHTETWERENAGYAAKRSSSEKARDAKAKIEKLVRREVLTQTLAKASSLSTDDLRLVADRLFNRLYHPMPEEVAMFLGWAADKKAAHQFDRAQFRRKVNALAGADLARVILACALWADAVEVGRSWGTSDADQLNAAAKRHGVKVAAITVHVKAGAKAKRSSKRPSAVAKGKKAKKGKAAA